MQKKKIQDKKIVIEQNISKSSSVNFTQEIIAFFQLRKSIKKYKPDIVHCASPKGIIFGGLISQLLNIKSIVIFNSGMGFLFSNKINLKFKFFRFLYIFLLKNYIMRHTNKKIIVENKDDYFFLKKKYNLLSSEIKLIKGAGVDLSKFKFFKKKKC